MASPKRRRRRPGRRAAPALPSGELDRLPGFAEVRAAAREWRAPVYLVGGALRDAALGWPRGVSTDLDLAVQGPARAFASELRRRLGPGSACFVLHEETDVHRVAVKAREGRPAFQVDVARLQGEDILTDLARRDFTVNAMALPLAPGGALADPYGGLRDLRRRVLRPVSAKAFRKDPLRALRVFRLASQLGLEPSREALAGARASRRLVRRCSAERVQAELAALLSIPAAERLRQMDAAGLLTAVLPELEPLRACARVYYGAGGALKHSIDTVDRLDQLLSGLDAVYPAAAGRIREAIAAEVGGPSRHPALLRLIALIHDVSKPQCARRIGGRLRFFGHEARGAQRAADILRRLRCSREEVDLAALLVRHHLRPGNLAAAGVVTEKAVFRFFRDLRGHGVALLLLCWADHASYLRPAALERVLPFIREDPYTFDPRRIRDAAPSGKGRRASTAPIGDADTLRTLSFLQVISLLLSRYFDKPETARPVRLLDGREVMRLLRIPPGPRVGEVLRLLEEAQAEGRVRDREQAASFVSSLRAPK